MIKLSDGLSPLLFRCTARTSNANSWTLCRFRTPSMSPRFGALEGISKLSSIYFLPSSQPKVALVVDASIAHGACSCFVKFLRSTTRRRTRLILRSMRRSSIRRCNSAPFRSRRTRLWTPVRIVAAVCLRISLFFVFLCVLVAPKEAVEIT